MVLDLTQARELTDLDAFRTILGAGPEAARAQRSRRGVRRLDPATAGTDPMLRATRRALEGVVRSIGKELRAGATANLVTRRRG